MKEWDGEGEKRGREVSKVTSIKKKKQVNGSRRQSHVGVQVEGCAGGVISNVPEMYR